MLIVSVFIVKHNSAGPFNCMIERHVVASDGRDSPASTEQLTWVSNWFLHFELLFLLDLIALAARYKYLCKFAAFLMQISFDLHSYFNLIVERITSGYDFFQLFIGVVNYTGKLYLDTVK